MSLLTIVQDAADEIGVPRPTTVISNTDEQIRKLLALSNRDGRSWARDYDWTILQRLHTFTTTASTADYSLPTDYGRLLPQTEWDRANKRQLIGPTTRQLWETIKSGLIGSGVVGRRYQIVRSSTTTSRIMSIDPTPTVTGDTLAYWYVSTSWLSDTTAVTLRSAWSVDTDVPLLNSDLLTLSLIVRYKRSKGLDFASEADELEMLFKTLAGQDRPAPYINMSYGEPWRLLDQGNLPETGLP